MEDSPTNRSRSVFLIARVFDEEIQKQDRYKICASVAVGKLKGTDRMVCFHLDSSPAKDDGFQTWLQGSTYEFITLVVGNTKRRIKTANVYF